MLVVVLGQGGNKSVYFIQIIQYFSFGEENEDLASTIKWLDVGSSVPRVRYLLLSTTTEVLAQITA